VSHPERIVPVEDLPTSLWSEEILHIAPDLAAAYCAAVRSRGLEALACARDAKSPPVGGVTQQLSDKHFAQAFDGSVARTALAFLDPKSEVAHVADALAKVCAGGRIAILDVPSGAGAFSLSILCGLAELRASGTVPRQPLDVLVVGGEFNPRASEHATDLHHRLKSSLAAQAIHIEHKAMSWDVCDPMSTTDLLRRFVVDAAQAERKLVAVSNFSDFLKTSGKWQEAEPQLDEIFRFCSGSCSTALWLEPQTNAATHSGGILSRAVDLFKRKLNRVAHLVGIGLRAGDDASKTQANFALPLQPGRTAVARLAVLRFDLQARTP
jgi:hypothetical protein